jgi:hypothetical protein
MPIQTQYAITLAGVQCYEEPPQEKFGRHGSEASRVIVCAWPDRVTLINTLLGGVTIVNNAPVNNAPASYPDAPWLYCQDCELLDLIGPYNIGSQGMLGANMVRYRFIYKPLEALVDGQEIGAENLDVSSQFLTLQPGSLQWQSHQSPILGAGTPGLHVTQATFTKEVRSLPTLPSNVIFSLAGTVNDATFLGADTGKLLFGGLHSTRRFIVGGTLNWDVTWILKFRSIPWNQAYRPPNGTSGASFETFQLADGSAVYPTADFTQMGFGP